MGRFFKTRLLDLLDFCRFTQIELRFSLQRDFDEQRDQGEHRQQRGRSERR